MAFLFIGLCPNGFIFGVPAMLSFIAIFLTLFASFDCTYMSSEGIAETIVLEGQDLRRILIGEHGSVGGTNTGSDTNITSSSNHSDTRVSVGLWTVEELDLADNATSTNGITAKGECTLWDHSDFDWQFNMARVVSVVAVAVSILLFFVILFLSFVRVPAVGLRNMYRIIFFVSWLLAILMGLSLVAVDSEWCDENCKLGWAGYCAIGSIVVWVLGSLVVCFIFVDL